MAAKWVEVPLEQLKAQTKSAFAMGPFGSRIKAENFKTVGVPVIKGGNLNATYLDESNFDFLTQEKADELESAKTRRLDIVITHRGTLGQVGLVPEDSKYEEYVVSQSQLKMSFDIKRVDPYFVYYFLKSPLGQSRLLSNVSQVGVPAIAQALTSVRAIEIPIPEDRSEQVRVSSVLRSLDNKIDVNRRLNQILEAMAQAIFKSWFVDFDPVKAKIAAIEQGEDPLRAAMRAISGKTDTELDQMPREHHDQLAATAALFPDEMDESELGEIPKGWEVSTIGEMVEIAGGATPDTKNESYWNPPEHFWTSPKDLSGAQSPVLLATERRISTAGLSRIGSGLLPKGTLLMSSRAPIGYLAITQMPVAINQGYIAMLPGAKLPPLYLLMWCQQNMEQIKGQANGSTFMEISKKAFRPMPVIYPGSDLMGRFVEAMSPLFEQLVARVKESSLLADLRDALLPRLLSGELTVSSDLNDEESQ